MRKALLEDIERMNQISDYLVQRDWDNMRTKLSKEISYRGYVITKDLLGTYSTNIDGVSYTSNKEWKVKDFIDKKIEENPNLEDSGEE